jgi:hypothetical protein
MSKSRGAAHSVKAVVHDSFESSPSMLRSSRKPCTCSVHSGTHSAAAEPSEHSTPSCIASVRELLVLPVASHSATVGSNWRLSFPSATSQSSHHGRKTSAQAALHVPGLPLLHSSPGQHARFTAAVRACKSWAAHACGPTCSRRCPCRIGAHASWWQRSNAGSWHSVRPKRPLCCGQLVVLVSILMICAASAPARCVRRRAPSPESSVNGVSLFRTHVASSSPTRVARFSCGGGALSLSRASVSFYTAQGGPSSPEDEEPQVTRGRRTAAR